MPALDLLAVAALLALLVVAYRHPRRRVEAGVSVAAVAAVVGAGLLPLARVRATVLELLPVVLFLVAILVTAHVCDRAGLFTASGRLLRGHGASRLLAVAFLVAAAVTAVLSLDATVVLLTPVVVAAARADGVPPRPSAYACLRMANSASLLLPVSNLTNLLAMPHLDLTFAGFAARTAPVLLVVLVVEYVGLRLLFRRDLVAASAPSGPGATDDVPLPTVPMPTVPAAVVAAMLAGFAATSPVGVDPAWVAGAAALALVVWGARRGLLTRSGVARSAHAEFALLVLALGLVVAAIADGFLGDAVAGVVPDSTSYGGLLAIALLATALANLLTNLSAALLLVPLVAPLGETAVLAALVGLNVGSGLTLSGSLANLLWRRTLHARGEHASLAQFHRVALLLTPVSLVAAVTALHLLA